MVRLELLRDVVAGYASELPSGRHSPAWRDFAEGTRQRYGGYP